MTPSEPASKETSPLYFIDLDASTVPANPEDIVDFVLDGAIPIERTFEFSYRQGFVHLAFENLGAGVHLLLNVLPLRLKL